MSQWIIFSVSLIPLRTVSTGLHLYLFHHKVYSALKFTFPPSPPVQKLSLLLSFAHRTHCLARLRFGCFLHFFAVFASSSQDTEWTLRRVQFHVSELRDSITWGFISPVCLFFRVGFLIEAYALHNWSSWLAALNLHALALVLSYRISPPLWFHQSPLLHYLCYKVAMLGSS